MISSTSIAVVVTYNRLNLLKECISGLRVQTHQLTDILVINNSSNDGTEEWLNSQADLIVITQPNEGGASGFYTGIKESFERGYEWIWCMDDDGCPDPNALERLLTYEKRKPCVINSLVLNKDDHNEILFAPESRRYKHQLKTPTLEGVATFFNATLFHNEVIRKSGFPMKNLIIWGDETEYANRICFMNHFQLFTVTNSYHFHPGQHSKFYTKEWPFKGSWKVYFYIRNKSFVLSSRYAAKFIAVIQYLIFLTGFFFYLILKQKKDKGRKVRLFLKAAKDGMNKNTDLSIKQIQDYINVL
jgi:GT2 family glycosyltransferase